MVQFIISLIDGQLPTLVILVIRVSQILLHHRLLFFLGSLDDIFSSAWLLGPFCDRREISPGFERIILRICFLADIAQIVLFQLRPKQRRLSFEISAFGWWSNDSIELQEIVVAASRSERLMYGICSHFLDGDILSPLNTCVFYSFDSRVIISLPILIDHMIFDCVIQYPCGLTYLIQTRAEYALAESLCWLQIRSALRWRILGDQYLMQVWLLHKNDLLIRILAALLTRWTWEIVSTAQWLVMWVLLSMFR